MPPVFGAITLTAILTQVAIAVVTNFVVAAITRALTKKPKTFAPPINVTVRNSIENRRLVFGTRRVGGSFVYINTSSSGGSKADLLWYVIVFTGHEVEDIGDVYLDNQVIADGDINDSTGVIGGSTRFVGKLKVWRRLGTSAQSVLSDLDSAFTEIDSNFRLRGCAYIVLRMTRDDVAFFQGPPQNITAIVTGIRYYDPRNDSTNGGSGSERPEDPSTWTAGNNFCPPLQALWYLTGGSVCFSGETSRLVKYGLGVPFSRIDLSFFIAAANICDASLSGAVQPPTGTAPRFRGHLEASTGESHRTILQEFNDAMAGELIEQHGRYRIFAAAYDAPLHSFTEEDLYGEMQIIDTTEGTERYNAVAGVFVDAAAGYAEKTTPFRTNSSYETQDGGRRIPREIDLRAVTNVDQAQRCCEIVLRRSRMMRTVKFIGSLNWLKVGLNETFTYTDAALGWVNEVFRCIERMVEVDEGAGRVTITARQESSAVYTDILSADYLSGTSSVVEFKAEIPDAPVSLTTETQVTSVRVTVLTTSAFQIGGDVVELYEHTASTPFASATKVAEGSAQDPFIVQHRDQTTRYYWARVRSRTGALSDTFPASTGQSGVPSFAQTGDIGNEAVDKLYNAENNGTGTDTGGGTLTLQVTDIPQSGRAQVQLVGQFSAAAAGRTLVATADGFPPGGGGGPVYTSSGVTVYSGAGEVPVMSIIFSFDAIQGYDYDIGFVAVGGNVTWAKTKTRLEIVQR